MAIKNLYTTVRNYTTTICSPLQVEDYVPQPAPFVSPPKWHLAHTTWFFEQFVLKEYNLEYTVYDSDFCYLFNSYYNNVGKRVFRTDRGNISRPGVEAVFAYRAYVDKAMVELLSGNLSDEALDTITLGLHHEQQHQELLLTDIKYILGSNPTFPVFNKELHWESDKNDAVGFVAVPEGVSEFGYRGDGFCFDNELGPHKVYLHQFEISKALVTNGEFIAFINDGGYENFNLWLDDGWSWIQANNISAPMYWFADDNRWSQYTMSGIKEIDPDAILTHISYYEAAAFAEWKAMRLPTEFEWEAASDLFDWGKRWEWTNSAYLAYPFFKRPEGAIGEYNGKFMINQMVLRGGSCATSPNHRRNTYRNFFHPEERWQFNGIRLVKNL